MFSTKPVITRKAKESAELILVGSLVCLIVFCIGWSISQFVINRQVPAKNVTPPTGLKFGVDIFSSIDSNTLLAPNIPATVAPTYHSLGVYRVTAYCPCEKCCGKYADGVTASGYVIEPGAKFVAAPNSFPFGTVLKVPGYGEVMVLDRGGAIKGKRLDVFFPTHQEALNWGVKEIEVWVAK